MHKSHVLVSILLLQLKYNMWQRISIHAIKFKIKYYKTKFGQLQGKNYLVNKILCTLKSIILLELKHKTRQFFF